MQKRDHQLLNILKVQLQPIMDQINRKYKKFRQPVISATQLEHLFLESDPNYIRPDLAEGEVRPFEIVKDKYDNDVLRETATGKTYYNLETTTIEERLSNGFYCRPEDFLRDIKSLAKDAKNAGDKERTLKANELVSNVEVDVAGIASNTATIDWEALRQRQIQRAKAAAEKDRKRKAMQSIVDRVQSDTGGGNESDSQGPVVLGERIPGSHVATRFQPMSPPSHRVTSDLHLSNGTSQPSGQDDVQMGGVDDTSPVPVSDVMRPPSQWPTMEPKTTDDSNRATAGNTQLSQKSAITTVPPGISPTALANDASTTKTSDPSDRSSKWSTQVTNGYHPAHQHDTQNDSSQLLDTQIPGGISHSQDTSSQDHWPHSQLQHGEGTSPSQAPQSDSNGDKTSQHQQAPASLGNILNDSPARPTEHDEQQHDHHHESSSNGIQALTSRNSGSSSSQQHQVVIHEEQVANFLDELTDRTSGCTIEQLEQINRELMSEIWKTKGLWNRMQVLAELTRVFNETIADIEEVQGLLQHSQP